MATEAATDVVPVDQLETLLTCSICLEMLNDPRTLPNCFHSICKFCLEKFVKRHRDEAHRLGKEIENFSCPTCRSEFILKPQEEVAGMAINHFIRNMLEFLKIPRLAKVSNCFLCEKPPVKRCTTCEVFMCEKCFQAHEVWPSHKKHTVLSVYEFTLSEIKAKVRPKLHCKTHENKAMKFFCETCQELICRYCMEFNHVRSDHVCFPLVKVIKEQREVLSSRCDILEEYLKEGNKALKLISNAKQSSQDNAKKAKEKIIRCKQEILERFTQKLEEKAQLLINEVEKKVNEIDGPLAEQEMEVKGYVDRVKGSFSLAKDLFEKGNDEEVLSSQKMIDENVKKMKVDRLWIMKPVHDGNIEYQTTTISDNDLTTLADKLGEIACHPVAVFSKVYNTSVILNGRYEYGKQLKEWFGGQFQWRLCYRASRDGWGGQDFHRCSDNKGPTVTLVKVQDYIFGGYTDQNWTGKELYRQSDSSFVFSLRNKDNIPPFKSEVYQNNQKAIFCDPSYGPTFGGGRDLHISKNGNVNQCSYTKFGYTYLPPRGYNHRNEETKNLLAGTCYFTPTEVEVFY